MERANGYYWIKYFHWAVGKYHNGTWNLPGIETDFVDKELHEIGERIPSNEILKQWNSGIGDPRAGIIF